ncbi:hypothetical protein HDE_02228 [Halotydeus destructor]|nr:hypothetical protein HDE_02228 [Halotydeus destructor]
MYYQRDEFPVFLLSYTRHPGESGLNEAILLAEARYLNKIHTRNAKKIRRQVYQSNLQGCKKIFLGVHFIKADAIALAAVMTIFLGVCLLICGTCLLADTEDDFKLFVFKKYQPQNFSILFGLVMIVSGFGLCLVRLLFFDPNLCHHWWHSRKFRKQAPSVGVTINAS